MAVKKKKMAAARIAIDDIMLLLSVMETDLNFLSRY